MRSRPHIQFARSKVEAMRMNKVRFGSLPMKCWAMLLGLLVVTAAYTTLSETPAIMAALTTRELPVYNVDTQDKVLAISFDAAWGSANTE